VRDAFREQIIAIIREHGDWDVWADCIANADALADRILEVVYERLADERADAARDAE
jgi:trans-2-enoyl-CoA reductase